MGNMEKESMGKESIGVGVGGRKGSVRMGMGSVMIGKGSMGVGKGNMVIGGMGKCPGYAGPGGLDVSSFVSLWVNASQYQSCSMRV